MFISTILSSVPDLSVVLSAFLSICFSCVGILICISLFSVVWSFWGGPYRFVVNLLRRWSGRIDTVLTDSVDTIAVTRQAITDMRDEVKLNMNNVNQQFLNLATATRDQVAALSNELRTGVDLVRNEVVGLSTTAREQVATLSAELRTGINQVRCEVVETNQNVRSTSNAIHIAAGTVVGATGSLAGSIRVACMAQTMFYIAYVVIILWAVATWVKNLIVGKEEKIAETYTRVAQSYMKLITKTIEHVYLSITNVTLLSDTASRFIWGVKMHKDDLSKGFSQIKFDVKLIQNGVWWVTMLLNFVGDLLSPILRIWDGKADKTKKAQMMAPPGDEDSEDENIFADDTAVADTLAKSSVPEFTVRPEPHEDKQGEPSVVSGRTRSHHIAEPDSPMSIYPVYAHVWFMVTVVRNNPGVGVRRENHHFRGIDSARKYRKQLDCPEACRLYWCETENRGDVPDFEDEEVFPTWQKWLNKVSPDALWCYWSGLEMPIRAACVLVPIALLVIVTLTVRYFYRKRSKVNEMFVPSGSAMYDPKDFAVAYDPDQKTYVKIAPGDTEKLQKAMQKLADAGLTPVITQKGKKKVYYTQTVEPPTLESHLDLIPEWKDVDKDFAIHVDQAAFTTKDSVLLKKDFNDFVAYAIANKESPEVIACMEALDYKPVPEAKQKKKKKEKAKKNKKPAVVTSVGEAKQPVATPTPPKKTWVEKAAPVEEKKITSVSVGANPVEKKTESNHGPPPLSDCSDTVMQLWTGDDFVENATAIANFVITTKHSKDPTAPYYLYDSGAKYPIQLSCAHEKLDLFKFIKNTNAKSGGKPYKSLTVAKVEPEVGTPLFMTVWQKTANGMNLVQTTGTYGGLDAVGDAKIMSSWTTDGFCGGAWRRRDNGHVVAIHKAGGTMCNFAVPVFTSEVLNWFSVSKN